MTGHLRKLAVVGAATLALAACGDDGTGTSGTPDTGAETTSPATEGAADGDEPAGEADAEVAMVDISFEPAEVEVPVGGTVHWTNEDEVTHTVTFDDGPDSGDVPGGGTFEHTFDEPGEHDYVCTIHGGMAGTVTVEG